jgi:hypothetical protein
LTRTADEVIDKSTDFRLMALLPGTPEVIGKQSEWRDCLISVIGGQFFRDAERCSHSHG